MKHIYILRSVLLLLIAILYGVSATASPIFCANTNPKILPDGEILSCFMKPVIAAESSDAFQNPMPFGMDNPELLNMKVNPEVAGIQFTGVHSFGSDAVTQIGRMVTDAFGNSYFTGGFSGTMTLGSDVLVSTSGYDFFIAKFDPNSNPVWARMAHGITLDDENLSLDGGLALAIDNDGNLYAGGSFVKSLTFLDENGDVAAQLTDGRDDDLLNLELFVVKYDNDGNLLWTLGGESGSPAGENSIAQGINTVNDLVLGADDFPYIVGRFSGTNFMGEEVSLIGESDAYIASLDKDGEYLYWVSTTGTPTIDIAMAASADNLGYINVIGTIGAGRMELPDSDLFWDNNTGANDTFIISYDVNGEWYFASFLGAGEQVTGNAIASAELGEFFVTGFFEDEASFDGSDIILEMKGMLYDGFLAKYDLNGNALWAVQFGGNTAEGQRIVLDENENVYVLGSYTGHAIFGAETDSPVALTTDSPSQMFIAKYDTEGVFQWVKQIEGDGRESRSPEFMNSGSFPFTVIPLDIQLSQNNPDELLIVGDFDGTISLDEIQAISPTGARLGFAAGLNISGEIGPVSVNPSANGTLPVSAELLQNFPNPFNPSTSIRFSLPQASDVRLDVYDMSGRLVRTLVNENRHAGSHEVVFEAGNLASGVYTYNLKVGSEVITRRLTLIK
ncbi:MAG: T9SS type A sorting domain-containing protein [Balneolales bacterium]|nr:T9SS type A sorting domain-containing protein [Balneolales bacterium]